MDEPMKTIMEVRESFMVSPAGDSKPTLRTAHFLKPTADANCIDGSVSEALSSSFSSVPPVFEPKEWPLTIHFKGWSFPRKWVVWVDTLQPKYESLWKKVGIFEAIMSTKFHILKAEELVLGVAEKWCPKTNTFVFPWGEATVTLEDVMVLGGYPLLGEPVFTTLKDREMKDVEEKLVLARREAGKSKHKASISAWTTLFMNSGREIEHEAFLVTWLSTFVFSHGVLVRESVYPIAVQLARGISIALAPAVLASIYKDLGLLKKTIVGLTKTQVVEEDVRFEVTLRSPFYLVQIWVWERFKNLQPNPKLINSGEPLLARWHKVKALKTENVRVALNSAMEHFLWRPYARHANSKCRVFYPENEMWIPFGTDLDKELLSFATCLRVSELVGFGSVTLVKQYLPHRVAMQFGMDQDIPASVPRFNETQAIAWENYCRPISDTKLYFPSRLFEADVIPRYVQWWKQSVLGHVDIVKSIVQQKRSPRSSKHGKQSLTANRSGNDAEVPPGFPPKHVSSVISGKSGERGPKTKKDCKEADVPPGFLTKRAKVCGTSVQDGTKEADENCDADVPNDCFPEHEDLSTANSFEDCMPKVLAESNCGGVTRGASTADHVAARETLQQNKPVVIVVEDDSESSMEALEKDFEDESGSREQGLSCDKESLSGNEGEGHSCSSEMNIVVELEERISRLERVIATKLKK